MPTLERPIDQHRTRIKATILSQINESGEITTKEILRFPEYRKIFRSQNLVEIFQELASEGVGRTEVRVAANHKRFTVFISNSYSKNIPFYFWYLYRSENHPIFNNGIGYEPPDSRWELIEDWHWKDISGYIVRSSVFDFSSLVLGWQQRGWQLLALSKNWELDLKEVESQWRKLATNAMPE